MLHYTHIYTHIYMYMCIYMCIYTYPYIYIRIRIYKYIIHTHYIHNHAHTYTYIDIHTYIQTYVHICYLDRVLWYKRLHYGPGAYTISALLTRFAGRVGWSRIRIPDEDSISITSCYK